MLLVETYIGKSRIHGIGLFAKKKIPKGTIIWKYTPGVDQKISKRIFDSLPRIMQEYIHTYAYVDKVTREYVLTADNDRFTNHSESPNSDCIGFGENDEITVASKDINQDEEITVDYRKIEAIQISFLKFP